MDWLIQADIAYQLYYRDVRSGICDSKGRGGCSRAAFRAVCAARALRADWDTGRNSRLSVKTIMAHTGLGERTVQTATRLMRILGLATEVFRGRQRTLTERYASWRVGDKGRGWASVYALHPPHNPQVREEKFRVDPLPSQSVAPHLLRGPFRAHSSSSNNSLTTTGTAGDTKSRASRDSARTEGGRARRQWAPPDPKGLLLARKWRQHVESPRWAQKHSLYGWARVLAPLAAQNWAPEDINHIIQYHPGLPYVATAPRKPLALMATLIKRYREVDDLAYRPAYHDILREQEYHAAADERRADIANCPHCGEDGYRTDDLGVPLEPVIRCDHTLRGDAAVRPQ